MYNIVKNNSKPFKMNHEIYDRKYVKSIKICLKCKKNAPNPIFCTPCYNTLEKFKDTQTQTPRKCIFCNVFSARAPKLLCNHMRFHCKDNPDSKCNQDNKKEQLDEPVV
jgi:hypothetical protein